MHICQLICFFRTNVFKRKKISYFNAGNLRLIEGIFLFKIRVERRAKKLLGKYILIEGVKIRG